MNFCPNCQTEIRDGKTFCGRCGYSPTTTRAETAGSSRIELDSAMVNTLLALFVNKPGAAQVQLVNGQLQLSQGEMRLQLDPVQLQQSLGLNLQHPQLGQLRLALEQLNLGARGLEIQLRLQ